MITDPRCYKQVQLEVLDTLITRELLWQEAKKENYVAKEKDLQGQIREFLRSEKVREGVQNRVETLHEEGKTDILLHL